MAKLLDSDLLVGEHETITAMDLRKGPGDILTQVAMGKVFTITKQGKPIAVLSRPEEQDTLFVASEIRRLGLAEHRKRNAQNLGKVAPVCDTAGKGQ